jgi:hypothetical protein
MSAIELRADRAQLTLRESPTVTPRHRSAVRQESDCSGRSDGRFHRQWRRQRVQDVDRPPSVKPLSEPTRHRCSRVDVKPALVVPRSEHSDGIAGDRRQSWAFGQRPPIGAKKSQLAVGLSFDLVALLVDGAMMPTTQ